MERIELSLSVWKTDVLPLNDIRLVTGPLVGKQGLEPRPPGPKPGALTLTPHPAKKKAQWRWPESNRLRRRLQGATATLAVTPDGQTAVKPPWPAVSWCSRYGRVNNQACTRGSHGRQELNPHSAGFGDRLPIRWLIPGEMKTASRGFPRGGHWRVPLGAYPATTPIPRPIRAARSGGTGFMYPARFGACHVVICLW